MACKQPSRKPTQTERPRLPLEDAFHRLLPSYQPHSVCEDINEALRRGKSRLWCNGSLVTPQYIRGQGLYVQAEPDPDGRWRCTIKSRLPMEPQEYYWELEQIESSEVPRRAVTKHDWPQIAAQIARECVDAATGRVRVPKSQKSLAEKVLKWSGQVLGKEPPISDLNEYVRRICAVLRAVQK